MILSGMFGTGAGSVGVPAVYAWATSPLGPDIALTNSNLTATRTGTANATRSVISNVAVRSGKTYFEINIDTGGASPFMLIGLGANFPSGGGYAGDDTTSWAYYQQTGQKYTNASGSAYGATYTTSDVVQVAYDSAAGKLWFGKNNTWQASGDPSAGTGEAFSSVSGTLYVIVTLYQGTTPAPHAITAAFAAADQTYSPPSGFSALSS